MMRAIVYVFVILMCMDARAHVTRAQTVIPIRVDASGPHIHAPSGMIFPEKIGGFARKYVSRLDIQGLEETATYITAPDDGDVQIDIQIFPTSVPVIRDPSERSKDISYDAEMMMGILTCEGEFNQAVNSINTVNPDIKRIDEEPFSEHIYRGKKVAGLRSVFEYERPNHFGRSQKIRHELIYFCRVGLAWTVKYNIYSPANGKASKKVETFIRDLPWAITCPLCEAKAGEPAYQPSIFPKGDYEFAIAGQEVIKFPEQIDAFKRYNVQSAAADGTNIGVGYVQMGNIPIQAKIYVFPLSIFPLNKNAGSKTADEKEMDMCRYDVVSITQPLIELLKGTQKAIGSKTLWPEDGGIAMAARALSYDMPGAPSKQVQAEVITYCGIKGKWALRFFFESMGSNDITKARDSFMNTFFNTQE